MHPSHRPDRRDWMVGLAAGAIVGFVVLGIGGRAGMRIIALAAGQPGAFTPEGSLAVALLGAASGAIISVIFLLLRTLLPTHRGVRGALFWLIVGAVALRGIRPVTTLNSAVFLPLFLVHGTLLHLYWCRVHLRRVHRAAPTNALGDVNEPLPGAGARA